MLYKSVILFFLFFVSFSSLNANEITFSLSDYWRETNNSTDNDKFYDEYKSEPFAYTIGIKNWKNGILNKQKGVFLKKFYLLYTAEYSVANAQFTGIPSTGSFKTRLSNESYEIYIARKLNNKLKFFLGYGYKRIKAFDKNRKTTTGKITSNTHLKYWYHPIGVIWEINPKWLLKSQYNLWNHGQINATGGHEYHYNYDYGWGVDFNISKKITNKFSLFTFYKYWDVDDSNWEPSSADGSTVSMYPKSESEEIGVGISYAF